MVFFSVEPTLHLLAAPLLAVGALLTALGVGIGVAGLAVRYRDVTHILPFVSQLWLYASPVVYPSSMVPDRWRWLLHLNPMAGYIEGFRSAFLGRPFDLEALSWSVGGTAVALIVGVLLFMRLERGLVDVL